MADHFGLSPRSLRELFDRIKFGHYAHENEQFARDWLGEPTVAFRSHMLDSYSERAGITRRQQYSMEEHVLTLPRVFSLIDNPNETLAFLARLVGLGTGGTRRFFVDQSALRSIDFCAGLLLNVLAGELGRRMRVQFRGTHPLDEEALEISIATGLPQALGVPMPRLRNFDAFPLWSGGRRSRSPYGSGKRDTVGSELISRINQNYKKHGHEIANEAKVRLAELVGEVLDNAETHYGTGWWVSGYVREPHGKQYGDCHLALFNLGPSLSETLQELPKDTELRVVIEDLVEQHTRSNAFGLRPGRWTEDDLWTLYALQEGVTRRFGEENRGFGTIDMIETFERIGKSDEPGLAPRMCIVSGRTHILFDGRYHLSVDRDGKQIIAFNDQCDLAYPPADGTVTHLDHHFPGTIISLRFYIDSRYLDRTVEADAD